MRPSAGLHTPLLAALCAYADRLAQLPFADGADSGRVRTTWASTRTACLAPKTLHAVLALQAQFQACFAGFTPPEHVALQVETSAADSIHSFSLYINKRLCWRHHKPRDAQTLLAGAPRHLKPGALGLLVSACPPLVGPLNLLLETP